MIRHRTVGQIEADLLALRSAAERAGLALACVFSSAAEYEADTARARRASRRFGRARHIWPVLGSFIVMLVLVTTFLLF